jgi:hypothetical protein
LPPLERELLSSRDGRDGGEWSRDGCDGGE